MSLYEHGNLSERHGAEKEIKAGIVVLARCTSVRLPRKSLRQIAGKSVFEHQIERLSTSREADLFVLATTPAAADDDLCRIATTNGLQCFRGDAEDEVLRLIQVAARFGLDCVVLVNGDNLFCEGWLVDAVVAEFRRNPADLIRIGNQPFDPSPYGVSTRALHEVMKIKAGPSTDGWGRYLTDTGRFVVTDLAFDDAELDKEYIRFDLDYPEDLELFRAIYDRLYHVGRQPPIREVVRLLTVEEPHLVEINRSAVEKWIENRDRVPVVVKPRSLANAQEHGQRRRETRANSGIVMLARSASIRLPRKSLQTIADRTVLEHQIERLSTSKTGGPFVLATTQKAEDDELCRIAATKGIECFRGEAEDVVLRLIQVARQFALDFIALVNGDNLFCEGWLIDSVVTEFNRNPADLIRIGKQPFDPSPLGVSVRALRKVMEIKAGSTDGWDRYVTDTGHFRVYDIPFDDPALDGKYVRLDLDYPEDLELFRAVYDRLYHRGRQPTLKEVIRLLTIDEPELVNINSAAIEKWHGNRDRVPVVTNLDP